MEREPNTSRDVDRTERTPNRHEPDDLHGDELDDERDADLAGTADSLIVDDDLGDDDFLVDDTEIETDESAGDDLNEDME
jgi:hypothetical protein